MNTTTHRRHELGYTLVAVLMLLCTSLAHAELNSKQRLRAFAALPDWSGLWELDSDAAYDPVGDTKPTAEDIKFLQSYQPPYNAEWQAKFQADNRPPAKANCIWGFPNLMVSFQFQAIVTPEETTLIFATRELRHVFTDGRAHPAEKDLWPTPWGDSIGRWEGQTLVIDTIAANSKMRIFNIVNNRFVEAVAALSDQAHFTERLRMLGKDKLEDQITIDDPIAFTHPWTYTVRYRRAVDYDRLIDDECTGNERNPVVDGKFTVTTQ